MGIGERVSLTHSRAVAFGIAAVAVSIFFAAGHLSNPGESAVGIIATFLLGIVFSYTLWRTGSLWWAIGFHMLWDWARSFLFSVPDSGALSAGSLFQTHARGDQLSDVNYSFPSCCLIQICYRIIPSEMLPSFRSCLAQ
jgi:hypothetical protein